MKLTETQLRHKIRRTIQEAVHKPALQGLNLTPEQTVVITKLMDRYQILGISDDNPAELDLGEGAKVEIYADGSQRWFLNGQLHRTDGPAEIYADGSQVWWLNRQLHRTDGPAEIYADGSQRWWLNGQRHRTDGPAVIYADGSQVWWLNGQVMTQAEHTAAVRKLRAA